MSSWLHRFLYGRGFDPLGAISTATAAVAGVATGTVANAVTNEAATASSAVMGAEQTASSGVQGAINTASSAVTGAISTATVSLGASVTSVPQLIKKGITGDLSEASKIASEAESMYNWYEQKKTEIIIGFCIVMAVIGLFVISSCLMWCIECCRAFACCFKCSEHVCACCYSCCCKMVHEDIKAYHALKEANGIPANDCTHCARCGRIDMHDGDKIRQEWRWYGHKTKGILGMCGFGRVEDWWQASCAGRGGACWRSCACGDLGSGAADAAERGYARDTDGQTTRTRWASRPDLKREKGVGDSDEEPAEWPSTTDNNGRNRR